MPAIEELFPYSEHRYRVGHIHTNFKTNYRGKDLKDQLWNCAKASNIPTYERAMEKLKEMSLSAFEYLKIIDPHHWSRSHFQTKNKCDILLNNMCECFNNQILEARVKSIVAMNEIIMTALMVRIQKKRDEIKRCQIDHCPKILKNLEKNQATQLVLQYNLV